MSQPFLEIIVSVHDFQRRWCWQLSSLVQQKQGNGTLPHGFIKVSAAHIEGTGEPTTKQVIDHFSPLIKVMGIPYHGHSRFQYRGYVRSDSVRQSTGKWLLFTDADMLFSPRWCQTLVEVEEELPHDKVVFTGRFSTTLQETNDLVDVDGYPFLVEDAWEKALRLPAVRRKSVGAGFCQLVYGDFMRARGYYVPEGQSRDWNWDKKHSRCKSDHQFRREVGAFRADHLLPWLIHLQHLRDSDFGRHISIQR